MIDIRRPLFKIEEFSPGLARRLWALTQIKMSPPMLALGLTVDALSDSAAQIKIPNHIQNKDESGHLQTSALTTAAEFAARLIWYRHLNPDLFELTLTSTEAYFLKPSKLSCYCTCEVPEVDRENILRQANAGKTFAFDMQTVTKDEKGQQVCNQVFHWTIRPLKPVALTGGTYGS